MQFTNFLLTFIHNGWANRAPLLCHCWTLLLYILFSQKRSTQLIMIHLWVSSCIMASEVSCRVGSRLIWVRNRKSMSNLTLSVPQGSVLGPSALFFCISISCIDPLIWCILYIFLTIQQIWHATVTINNVYATVNRELVGVDSRLKANRYSLNVCTVKFRT